MTFLDTTLTDIPKMFYLCSSRKYFSVLRHFDDRLVTNVFCSISALNGHDLTHSLKTPKTRLSIKKDPITMIGMKNIQL